jgi:hypothetical protein
MPAVKKGVDLLEESIDRFIASLGVELKKRYKSQMRRETELHAFKEEMRLLPGRHVSLQGRDAFFKEEMGAFTDEMGTSKDRMDSFRDQGCTHLEEAAPIAIGPLTLDSSVADRVRIVSC